MSERYNEFMDRFLGDMMDELRSQDPEIRQKAKKTIAFSTMLGLGNVSLSALNAGARVWDAIIGPVPIHMVTYYDFAESDSVVKYRAFGGEFFAHQGGDKTALRVDFLLVGPEKEAWINALRFLRLVCKGTTRGQTLTHQDESYLFDPVNARGEGLWRFKRINRRRALFGSGSTDNLVIMYLNQLGVSNPNRVTQDHVYELRNLLGINDITLSDVKAIYENRYQAAEDSATTSGFTESSFFGLEPANDVDPLSIKRLMTTDDEMTGFTGEYEAHSNDYYEMQQLGYFTYHFNFPVMVDNMIFTDMWLETIQFTKDSQNGVDAIVGHMLLRKYIKPPKLRWTANGRNPSRLHGIDTHNDDNQYTSRKAIDKWIWIWQDKQSPNPQYIEYGIGLAVGIAKSAIRYASNPYKYIGAGLFQKQVRTVRSSVSI